MSSSIDGLHPQRRGLPHDPAGDLLYLARHQLGVPVLVIAAVLGVLSSGVDALQPESRGPCRHLVRLRHPLPAGRRGTATIMPTTGLRRSPLISSVAGFWQPQGLQVAASRIRMTTYVGTVRSHAGRRDTYIGSKPASRAHHTTFPVASRLEDDV